MSDICVVHLVWNPLGSAPLGRFLEAYRRAPAGQPHRLVVLFNGFIAADNLEPYRRLLAGTAHEELTLPEPVQDIPAYLAAARRLSCEYLCFLNSYSEPLAAGWLEKLHSNLVRDGVGLVGATGSWESHLTNMRRAIAPGGIVRSSVGALLGRRKFSPRIYLARRRQVAGLGAHFEAFPSPHLRTNGLMVRRELLLGLKSAPIHDKLEALRFEAGRGGMTRQVESLGLQVLVVTRDGRAHPPAEWWRIGGYRSGDQGNLLIADNRTREFATANAWERRRMLRNAWGSDPEATSRELASRDRRAGSR